MFSIGRTSSARFTCWGRELADMNDFFEVSRETDLFTVDGLTKFIGLGPEDWLRAAVKELVDNALDAREGAGVQPSISVDLRVATTASRLRSPTMGRGFRRRSFAPSSIQEPERVRRWGLSLPAGDAKETPCRASWE